MGAQESVEERRPSLECQLSYDRQSSHDDLIRLYVAGCTASTSVGPLINGFLGFGYRHMQAPNIDSDSRTHSVTVDEETVKLQIWNLYGVGYLGLSPVIFQSHPVGLMVLYDVVEERSFERAKELIKSAQEMNRETSILLVGGHYQEKKEREVEYYTAREFADERDIPALEISCGKEKVNVELAFMTLIASVLSKK